MTERRGLWEMSEMEHNRFSRYRPSMALQQAIAAWRASIEAAGGAEGAQAMEKGRSLRPGQVRSARAGAQKTTVARREEDSRLRRTRNCRGKGGGYATGKGAEWGGEEP